MKEALQQALFLFPINPLHTPTANITTPKICAYHNHIDLTKGDKYKTVVDQKQKQKQINKQYKTHTCWKDKWVTHTTNKHYICQRNILPLDG